MPILLFFCFLRFLCSTTSLLTHQTLCHPYHSHSITAWNQFPEFVSKGVELENAGNEFRMGNGREFIDINTKATQL